MTQPNGISVDGNSIVISNCTLTIDNAFDPTTGIATITITPLGGVGTLPGLLEGQPGLPALWRNVNLTQVAYGDSLPSPAASVTQIYPGGPGVSAIYDLNIWLNNGAPGSSGTFSISGAEDLIGSLIQGVTIVWDTVASAFNLAPIPIAVYSGPNTASSTSGTGAGPRTLASYTIAAQTFAWYPKVTGQTIVSGTVNTQVNLAAYIGSTSGDQVGAGYGAVGLTNQSVSIFSGLPSGSSGSYGQVASGTSATIIVTATQVGSNTDAWSTSDTTTIFSVTADPVPL